MTVLIKLFYAAAIAALLILLVAFGIRTFYPGPEMPEYPIMPFNFVPAAPRIGPDGTMEEPQRTPEQIEYEEAQRRYQEAYRAYEEARAGYHRNVFLIAAILGFVAVGGGIALPAQLDAIRLGLVAGGLGTMLYAVIQAGGDLDEAGSALIFLVVAVGLALVVASGYRWLSRQEADAGPAG